MGDRRIVWNDVKKGFISRKNQFDEEYKEDYCVVNVAKQKLKIYNASLPNKKIVLPLKTAQIEDFKEKNFTLTVEIKKKLEFHSFRGIFSSIYIISLAATDQEDLEWVDLIQKATLMNRPNMV